MFDFNIFRLISFLSFGLLLIFYEHFYPSRIFLYSKSRRWISNLSLTVFNTAMIKIILPGGLYYIAIISKNNDIGLLNYFKFPSSCLIFLISFIILDLSIYLQHMLFHTIPLLWRFHKVHHSDKDLDVTSGLRFHPVEILISLIYKAAIIILFGIDADIIIFFEIVLNSMAMFNHSNIYISNRVDKALRYILVTPKMHLIHHSSNMKEYNKNYSFNFSFWDRLFKTYLFDFHDSKQREIGLINTNKLNDLSFVRLILWPFRSRP